jgi:hypothetical protein
LKNLGVQYNVAMLRAGGTQSASELGREFGAIFALQLVQGLGFGFVAQMTAALGREFATIFSNTMKSSA